MPQTMRFECLQGHGWEVETESLGPTGNPEVCPVCGAPSRSPFSVEFGSAADLGDELPPPPPRPSVAAVGPDLAFTLWSPEKVRRRVLDDPPTIAGYEILGELGRGGMGVVYHARQASLGREVALKVVLAGAHAGWSERSRFRVEAETTARLKHPHIVPIYEIGEQDRLPYLAMEFVEGGSLAQAMALRPLAPDQAAGMAETLARAMDYVHQRGVVHRDLKPANVLLTADGVPRITDFGLAKWLDYPSGHQTQSGAILGTPSYMAPEQARGDAERVGPGTDVYALGAILYEMLTGRPPFHAATSQETVQQLLTEDPLPPSRLQPRVPGDLETICLKCLQKDPARRYGDAGGLADDLRCFLDRKPIRARPTPSWERAAKWARRRPAVAVLIGVSVAAAVALMSMGLAYNVRLRTERANANLQRDAARAAQARAEADFRLALDAAKRFYTEVSENKLVNVPTMDPLRIELLERARDFYRRIAEERPDDPEVLAEQARAGWRLAVMVSDARSVPEGIRLLDQPIAIQERLALRYPDRPEYQSDLARSYNNLGIMHRRNSQGELAGPDWERALALRERLVREHPDDYLHRRDLGQTMLNLGNWYTSDGQADRAEAAYRRALTILEHLAREAPDVARPRTDLPVTPFVLDPFRIRYDLALAYYNLAKLLRDTDRSGPAAGAFQQALEQLDRLVREQPNRAINRYVLAKTHYDLGVMFQADGQIGRAAAAWRRSRELLEALIREHPETWGYRYNLALDLRSLSLVADTNGRTDEAEATRRSARDVEERMIREHPDANNYYYEAALVYVNFPAGVIPDGKEAGAVNRKAFAEACAGHALSMLEAAEKAGYFRTPDGLKDLKSDKTLDPLRSRDDFRRLLDRVRAAEGPRGK